MVNRYTTIFFASLLGGLGVLTQQLGFVNLDDAWLIDAARRFVNGEVLNVDVVETNPPLIIYITALPVMLAQLLHYSAAYSFIWSTALLAILSYSFSFTIVKDTPLRILIVFGLLFMPNVIFGEREHFLVMLILPYFVSQISEEKPSLTYSLIAGTMAGIGFSIKPFFVIIWLTIMAMKWFSEKRFSAIVTLQNLLIGSIGLAYLGCLFFYEQNYVHNVLPLLLKYYGTFGTNFWETIKQSVKLIFAYQVAVLILFIKDRQRLDRRIYFCSGACIASIMLIVIQNKPWLNYFYPALFFSLLSNWLVIAAVFKNHEPLWNKVAGLIAGIIILILVSSSAFNNFSIIYGGHNFQTARMVDLFSRQAKGKAVYAISFDLGAIYPAVLYSSAQNHSKYGHLWMLPGIYLNAKIKNGETVYHLPAEMGVDEKTIFDNVITELKRDRPKVVAVMGADHNYYNGGVEYRFDFIKYFSSNAGFRELWRNYNKVGRIGDQDIFVLKRS